MEKTSNDKIFEMFNHLVSLVRSSKVEINLTIGKNTDDFVINSTFFKKVMGVDENFSIRIYQFYDEYKNNISIKEIESLMNDATLFEEIRDKDRC